MSITLTKLPLDQRQKHNALSQLLDLFLMELTNRRWSWRHMLIFGAISPLFGIFMFGTFARDSGPEALAYILTGNIVMSLLFGTMNSVESRVEWLRFAGGLEFYATLPVQRYMFVLAMVASFLLFSLPSVLVPIVAGTFWLQIPIQLTPWLLLIVPLCAVPLAGVGALVGITCRTRAEGGTISTVLTFLMTSVGPVMIPPDRLPDIVLYLGRLSPATYAASALRQTVIGPLTPQLVIDVAVLLGMSFFFLWLVGRKMNWQQA
ncbi:ABC transporter permease [Chloroflexi bacterium TSY]|nr:ABC transporter permease [Chloroflexi bacterium TSY]